MEEEILTCADCFHMGRAVYCMQCVRLGNGYKDMFVSNDVSSKIVEYYKRKYQNFETPDQPTKR